MTTMCDLPLELVVMIFTKIPITSIRSVRSTCRLWKALTNDWVLGKGAAREQFLGFMTMDSKVCSLRLHLRRKTNGKEDEDDLLDLSIKQVDLLNQVDISKVFHCEGLLLCQAKDNAKLMVWNPYLGQIRWIGPNTDFDKRDMYVLGYDINHNHKILRFVNHYMGEKHLFRYEIYDFSSNSWRVLDVILDWFVDCYQRSVSLKGNSYFFARGIIRTNFHGGYTRITCGEDFLLCFDFTRERFGSRLPLPFPSKPFIETVILSCVKEEQLAVLYQERDIFSPIIIHIWITTRIEPNNLSWSKFLRVEMRPFALTGVRFKNGGGSFLVDEQEKVIVVFDLDEDLPTNTARYHTAFIIGEDGYFKSVSLGEASKSEGILSRCFLSHVCSSSYLPSLVQLNQPTS